MTCLYSNCDARDDENKLAQFFNLTFDYTDDVLKYFHAGDYMHASHIYLTEYEIQHNKK